jgi:hypothetical protein
MPASGMPPTTERVGNVGMIRRWRGIVSRKDQFTAVEDFADPSFAEGLKYVIVDFSEVDSYDLTTAEIHALAERARVLGPKLRVAIVAPSDCPVRARANVRDDH